MKIIHHRIQFYGEGARFFGIYLINAILSILTLSLYYPWAKANTLQYIYRETEFAGDRFSFHGTGKEMFRGYIKALILMLSLYGILFVSTLSKDVFWTVLAGVVFFVGSALLVPLAIHGTMRYRFSRTSWRGIHFSYSGDLKELTRICFTGMFLSLVTLGIYTPWFQNEVRKYVIQNLRFGNAGFDFRGNGTDFFLLHVIGSFLMVFTFGIYAFWYFRDQTRFLVDNLRIDLDGQFHRVRTLITAGDFVRIVLMSLLVPLTLGLAYPWFRMEYLRAVLGSVEIEGTFDPSVLEQRADDYSDASGEDLADMLNLDINL